MQSNGAPPKFPVPFANAASAANVRPIPLGSQAAITPGAASLADGFPAVNFTPVSAGGIPPFGQDMNGILQQITAWVRWLSGGMPVVYDATFATLIGGYPKGTILSSASNSGGVWLSQVENNSTNPDAGGAGWISLFAPLAPLASPALTGVPTAPTAARSTNTNQIATTAFVLGQASVAAPIMDGIATIGVSTGFARADHIHPTDTSLAPQHNWAIYGTGNNTFTVPAGVSRLIVSVISGGGAGGTGAAYPGGGGGAGGRSKSVIGVSPGQVFYAFAGSGGVPSFPPGYGGNGVASAFSNSSNVTLVSASAGAGGAGNNSNPAGGAGGTWLAGQFGDGGSWGTDGVSVAGKGGDGGGPGGGRGTTGSYIQGIAANGYGGGGGGGAPYSMGGPGGPGIVIVEW